MADILIRGMEMPECCEVCPFEESAVDLYCDLAYKVIPPLGITERPDFCPLIALPEGHGRLVDGEALYKKSVELEQQAMSYVKARDGEEWKMWAAILTERTAFKFDVVDAPTIVPAEEDEK